MRNIVIAIASLLAIGFIVTQATAWNGGGHMGYGQGHRGYGYQSNNPAYNNADRQQFIQDTVKLRSQLRSARIELNHELAQSEPNMDRVRELNEQIVSNNAQIQKVAAQHNMPAQGSQAFGNGRGHRGPGYCWR